jgi:RES domain-containing protein
VALDVDSRPVRGVWFRHIPAGGEPLFRPKHPADGRWQRGEVVEGFYVADSEQTAWAEWYRTIAELELPPLRQLPRDLWQFEVDVNHVADLSSSERLERVGVQPPIPDRSQWPTFQTVGERLFAEGWSGVLYPATARPTALALCLFRGSDRFPGVRPLPPPARHDEPPAPPHGLRA